jgi:serine/threonine protein kinase
MTRDLTNDSRHEDRLNEVLLAYVESLQAGQAPDRCQLLAAHPDLRHDLEAFFAGHDQVERMAAPLRAAGREAAGGESLVRGWGPSDRPGLGAEAGGAPNGATADIGQLGDFRLLREVGRGGMGVVYEAEQISLRRRIALKVLPFAAAIDPRQLQRFKNEALAAAHLRHENIVPVHAVGSERGVHYYAMQFIEGQSLAALIGELRRLGSEAAPQPPAVSAQNRSAAMTTGPHFASGAPETQTGDVDRLVAASLSQDRSSHSRKYFDWVAGLGRQAALALEHAHQTGIVHRDIKPANLLLDPEGQLWVTDFGLAQFSTDTGLTVTGELLGTMRYASPEQVLGKRGVADHRSDVYSLGATLYELLTLRPIFDGRDRHELLRQIADEEPRPPRSVDRAIPEELGTIVLKAVAKEPSERYATAQELADDLQRFLDDQPIRARRPSLVEKTTKWTRRHKAVVVSAVVVLLLSVAGMSVTTLVIAKAYERERQKALEAEESFREARRAVDQLVRIGEEELAGNQELEVLRWRLLETALTYYQDFINQRREDSSIQADLEASRAKVETILSQLTILIRSYQYIPIHIREVQEELHLSEDQRKVIAQMHANWRERTLESMLRGPGEREQQRLKLARDQEEKVAQLLKPEQLRRFKQIALQFIGPLAFSDPEVADALRLSTDQKTQLRAILDQAGSAATKFGPRGGRGPSQREPSDDAARRAQSKILELLTPEQKRKWEGLVGEPFQVESRRGPPR